MKKKLMNMAAALLFCLAGSACADEAKSAQDKDPSMPDPEGVIIVTEEVAYVDGCENCPCTAGSGKCSCPDKTKCGCCLNHMKKVDEKHQKKCIEAKKAACAEKGTTCPRVVRRISIRRLSELVPENGPVKDKAPEKK